MTNPTCAGSLFEGLSLSKASLFVVTWLYVPHIPRKAASIKDFPQRGRKAASFMEAGFRGICGI